MKQLLSEMPASVASRRSRVIDETYPGLLCTQARIGRVHAERLAFQRLETARQGLVFQSLHGLVRIEAQVRPKQHVVHGVQRRQRMTFTPQRLLAINIERRTANAPSLERVY